MTPKEINQRVREIWAANHLHYEEIESRKNLIKAGDEEIAILEKRCSHPSRHTREDYDGDFWVYCDHCGMCTCESNGYVYNARNHAPQPCKD